MPHIKESDRQFMAAAIQEAKRAGIDVPVGSVVVKDGLIIGAGYNQRESTGDPTAHAEIVALREAAKHLGSWRLNHSTVFTTLEPCPMCAEAIIQSRVSRLVFGAWEPSAGACGSAFNLFVARKLFPIPEVVGGLSERECRQLMVDFFQNKR